MPSSHSRVRAGAILALTMLPSCIAQQDTAERMRAARNELFTASKEDVQLFRSPGYLARKINVVRDLMREEILRQLNAGGWSDSTLLKRLPPVTNMEPNIGLGLVHKRLNGVDFVIISYCILHGASAIPDSTDVIDAYRKGADGYELVDQTGDGLANSMPKLEELPSPWTTEIWLLGHGQQTGVMQYHERARIYSFDGQHFKELWGHEPMRDAKFEIDRNELKIQFVDEEARHVMWLTLALLPQGPKEISLLEVR